MSIDFQAYLNRINYTGPLTPSLSTLSALQKAHLYAVPFENLDIHLRRPIVLNPAQIAHKIVEEKRGGFCYELNGLYYELLKHLGFTVRRISGRVFNPQRELGPEFDHLAIIATIKGQEYLTDVGFGAFVFAPLRIELDLLQPDIGGDFSISQYHPEPGPGGADQVTPGSLVVNKISEGKSVAEYVFSRQERSFEEFTGMCNYHQSSPESHFSKKPFISMANPNGRTTLSGTSLKHTRKIENRAGTEVSESNLLDLSAYHGVLKEYFGVTLNSDYPVPLFELPSA